MEAGFSKALQRNFQALWGIVLKKLSPKTAILSKNSAQERQMLKNSLNRQKRSLQKEKKDHKRGKIWKGKSRELKQRLMPFEKNMAAMQSYVGCSNWKKIIKLSLKTRKKNWLCLKKAKNVDKAREKADRERAKLATL